MLSGAFRERFAGAWVEIRENLGRSTLQTLGVDPRRRVGPRGLLHLRQPAEARPTSAGVKLGGIDRLNVQPSAAIRDGQPTALQTANLGLRAEDADEGGTLDAKAVSGVSQQKNARARVRSAYADQDRQLTGIGGDYMALNGYTVEKGRELLRGGPRKREAGRPPRRRGRSHVLSHRRGRRTDDQARRHPRRRRRHARREGLPVARQQG